jgi:hypothetical protein
MKLLIPRSLKWAYANYYFISSYPSNSFFRASLLVEVVRVPPVLKLFLIYLKIGSTTLGSSGITTVYGCMIMYISYFGYYNCLSIISILKYLFKILEYS